MPAKRDVIAEVEQTRGRMTAVDDLDSGILKLLALAISVQRLRDDDPEDELNSYHIVASIAALESYFRWQIQKLIDLDSGRFIRNIRLDDQPLKLTHDVAVALVDKRLTIGELVAYTVGFSNLERVAGFMTKLLETDFIHLVATCGDSNHGNAPFLEDSAQVISDVKRALEIRHIICHEGFRIHLISNSEIRKLTSSCYMFACACHYAVSRFLDPAGAVTREDLYKSASIKADALQTRLRTLEGIIAEHLYAGSAHGSFRATEEAWSAYVEQEATFFASLQMNMNQGQLDAARTRVRLTEDRIEELQRWLDRIRKRNVAS